MTQSVFYKVTNIDDVVIAENINTNGDYGEMSLALKDIVTSFNGDINYKFTYSKSNDLDGEFALETLEELAHRFNIAYPLDLEENIYLSESEPDIEFGDNLPITLPPYIENKLINGPLKNRLKFVELNTQNKLLFGIEVDKIKTIEIWFKQLD